MILSMGKEVSFISQNHSVLFKCLERVPRHQLLENIRSKNYPTIKMENFETYSNAYTEDAEYPYAQEWTLTNLLTQIGNIEDETFQKKCEW